MATSASPISSKRWRRSSSAEPRCSAAAAPIWGALIGSIVLTEINTLLIGLGLQPSMVQAALGAVIILLVSLYGREPHLRTTI